MDKVDRQQLINTLRQCIDPLDSASHPDGGLIHISTGEVAPTECNVDRAVSLGTDQMRQFKYDWPGSFYSKLSKTAKTMDVKQ